jgi:CRISPR system Cascade subunit CasB
MSDTAPVLASGQTLDIVHFVSQLQRLVPRETVTGEQRGDRAALAALRRGLGKEPGEAPEMFPVLLPILPEAPLSQHDERVVYLVASLFALYPDAPRWPEAASERHQRNFGASLRQLADQTESDGPERRLTALFNSDLSDLPHHLRGIIALLRSASTPVPVDWVQFTNDLRRWNNPSRPVQRRWATAFWGGRQAQAETNETSVGDQESA